MKISGLVKTSLIDYPGKIAAVVFTQGCNFRCGFCHNPDLLPIENKALEIPEEEVLDFLSGRKGILDGLVVTGGEPTIQKDLPEFLKKLKDMGFLIKLDSNGSNPEILKKLFDEKLLDYVAMDIKGTYEEYEKICGYNNIKAIQESVGLIMNSGVEYEFRTTVLPAFHKPSDFEEIGKMIKGAKKYTIQGFRPEIVLEKNTVGTEKFSKEDLGEMATVMQKYVEAVVVHENF